jgi:hypothetical protein
MLPLVDNHTSEERPKPPVHLLMRYSDRISGYSTIVEHQKVLTKRGSVWIGKLGKRLSLKNRIRINKQCREGISSFVYLVSRENRRYKIHRGKILSVSGKVPIGEQKFVPKYYKTSGAMRFTSFWTKLESLDPAAEGVLQSLRVASSGSRATHVLAHSASGLFVVREASAA